MMKTSELQEMYLDGKNEEILESLFGDDKKFFNFEEYKKETKWNNKSFNPLYQLIELSEFLNDTVNGLSDEEKSKIFEEVVLNYVPS